MDFTLTTYENLLKTLKRNGYSFQTFYDYLSLKQSFNHYQPGTQNSEPRTRNPEPGTQNPEPGTRNPERLIILRHDVDLMPQNSLATANLEHELGIKGSYYFRMVPKMKSKKQSINQPISQPISSFMTREFAVRQSVNLSIFNPQIIRQIADLGHEIGYHYETMDSVSSYQYDFYARSSPFRGPGGAGGQPEQSHIREKTAPLRLSENQSTSSSPIHEQHITVAYNLFVQNLEFFRQIANIKTICMHGSPRSKFDNRDIWKKYSYRDLGIIGEPYFDIDFNNFFYLTDTGRRWDGHHVSVRDKMPQQERWNREGLRFHSTKEIITAANEGRLPPRIMITVHPQRWNKSFTLWAREFILQNAKNIVKRIVIGIS